MFSGDASSPQLHLRGKWCFFNYQDVNSPFVSRDKRYSGPLLRNLSRQCVFIFIAGSVLFSLVCPSPSIYWFFFFLSKSSFFYSWVIYSYMFYFLLYLYYILNRFIYLYPFLSLLFFLSSSWNCKIRKETLHSFQHLNHTEDKLHKLHISLSLSHTHFLLPPSLTLSHTLPPSFLSHSLTHSLSLYSRTPVHTLSLSHFLSLLPPFCFSLMLIWPELNKPYY